MYFIGGSISEDYTKQISKIRGCRLERVATFPDDVQLAACNTFSMPKERIWICFWLSDKKGCQSFDGENIRTEKEANHLHCDTTLGIFKGKPFVVGGYYPKNRKVERFDSSWIELPDFPFARKHIYWYSTVTVGGNLFLFGGRVDGSYGSDLAAKFDGSWSRVGSLLQSRWGHRSIARGNIIYHVGGCDGGRWGCDRDKYFEQWKIDGRNIERTQLEHKISRDYSYYPESFWVSADFCT